MTNEEKNLLQEMTNQLIRTSDLVEKSNELLHKKDSIIEQQKQIIEKRDSQLEIRDQIEQSGKWVDMKNAAKILGYKKLGRNIIFGILRDHKILMYNNEPYQQYVKCGYFKVHLKYIEQIDETITITMISIKGIDFIRKLLVEEGYVNETK